ncbi:efflux transporter outer membrane subunit [Caulobacter segnis]|uniref:efflux transporter outer membrane subunit n=1 Tax=Caulobacter segnis TaxID=88688 RepID=UPI00240FC937|nr:efflux transporter outer membrane subunit [Caulobacter segnis]MDG2520389.1 efflux transporter outer membrane subunit [Caulobacter segnis]
MRRLLIILLAGASTAACTLEPRYVRPDAPIPTQWPVGGPYPTNAPAAEAGAANPVILDARLQRLIATGLDNNRDLRVALANIAASRAQYRIQRAALLPELAASGRYTASRRSLANGQTGAGANVDRNSESYAAEIGINAFEVDLFGRVRSLARADLNRYLASEAGARATRLTLVGDIAEAWLNHAADQSLLKIAEETAANAERGVSLTSARLRGGVAPRTDLRQAETILATARADVARLRSVVAQDVNALQLLVGGPVDAGLLASSIDDAASAVALPAAGLSSTVLLNRPDVIEAEYGLRAANAEIGAARAALFPRISITGAGGFASDALSSLFTDRAFTSSISPGVTWSFFRAGAGLAGVDAARARQEAAVATYERAIQAAFRETADALARNGTIADQGAAVRLRLDAAADSYRLADARYRGGVDAFLSSLDAQRTFYSAQQAQVAIQLETAVNRIDLYRALGGGDPLDIGPLPEAQR